MSREKKSIFSWLYDIMMFRFENNENFPPETDNLCRTERHYEIIYLEVVWKDSLWSANYFSCQKTQFSWKPQVRTFSLFIRKMTHYHCNLRYIFRFLPFSVAIFVIDFLRNYERDEKNYWMTNGKKGGGEVNP